MQIQGEDVNLNYLRNLSVGESESMMLKKARARHADTQLGGITFGKRRIGYKDLVNVVRAEK